MQKKRLVWKTWFLVERDCKENSVIFANHQEEKGPIMILYVYKIIAICKDIDNLTSLHGILFFY